MGLSFRRHRGLAPGAQRFAQTGHGGRALTAGEQQPDDFRGLPLAQPRGHDGGAESGAPLGFVPSRPRPHSGFQAHLPEQTPRLALTESIRRAANPRLQNVVVHGFGPTGRGTSVARPRRKDSRSSIVLDGV